MTAFGRKEVKGEFGALIWELRSVNHRYLEVTLRLPEEFRGLERQLREKANAVLGRGKLECYLSYRTAPAALDQITLNEGLAKALIEATHRLEGMMNNPARIRAIDLLHWPGVTCEPERDTLPIYSVALEAFEAALRELVESRQREGARLTDLIGERCNAICELVEKVRERQPQVLHALREKLLARIAEFGVEPDANRLEQELVLAAQKLDVDEELDRLDSHCQELADALKREEPVGRRLDFLMQEFNREANTLASKASDVETIQAAVDLKVLIEQMREQVQNVE